MKPDDPQHRRMGTPLVPQRPLLHSQTPPERNHSAMGQAAANIARGQLNSIYSGNTHTPTPQTTPVTQNTSEATENPYTRTHTTEPHIQADHWKQYHSAWQEYYQKYYERYYVGQVHHAKLALEKKASEATGSGQKIEEAPKDPETLTRDEAMYDLRSKLVDKLQDSAKKVRKSRHFIPITAALCVMVVFLFLQYNRVLFSNVQAYISPGNIDPVNIIVNPSTTLAVGPEPKLIIPKINVDVPVNYDATPDYAGQMKAMENGVAYFGIPGANSKPGQIGNTVIAGHSSNDIIDQGNYKFIFARLEQLNVGDAVYANYEGKRYTYTITKKEVVKPTEVSKLVYPTDKPILTLITCTPLGTAVDRLLVTAEQVSPNPKDAAPAPGTSSANGATAPMPGNSPTFVQRLFGDRGQ